MNLVEALCEQFSRFFYHILTLRLVYLLVELSLGVDRCFSLTLDYVEGMDTTTWIVCVSSHVLWNVKSLYLSVHFRNELIVCVRRSKRFPSQLVLT